MLAKKIVSVLDLIGIKGTVVFRAVNLGHVQIIVSKKM